MSHTGRRNGVPCNFCRNSYDPKSFFSSAGKTALNGKGRGNIIENLKVRLEKWNSMRFLEVGKDGGINFSNRRLKHYGSIQEKMSHRKVRDKRSWEILESQTNWPKDPSLLTKRKRKIKREVSARVCFQFLFFLFRLSFFFSQYFSLSLSAKTKLAHDRRKAQKMHTNRRNIAEF